MVVVAIVVVMAMIWWLWPRSNPRLVIVGDSVTFLSIPTIQDRLDDFDLSIRAYPGQRSNELTLVVLDELTQLDAEDPPRDRIALLVGYNDVLRHIDEPDEVAELTKLAAGFTCGVVFTVPAPPPWNERPHDEHSAEEFAAMFGDYNAKLASEVAKHPNLTLDTRWQEAVEASEPGELVDTDGVHPIEGGQQRLAQAYDEAIDEAC